MNSGLGAAWVLILALLLTICVTLTSLYTCSVVINGNNESKDPNKGEGGVGLSWIPMPTNKKLSKLSIKNQNLDVLRGGGKADSRPWWENSRERNSDATLGIYFSHKSTGDSVTGGCRLYPWRKTDASDMPPREALLPAIGHLAAPNSKAKESWATQKRFLEKFAAMGINVMAFLKHQPLPLVFICCHGVKDQQFVFHENVLLGTLVEGNWHQSKTQSGLAASEEGPHIQGVNSFPEGMESPQPHSSLLPS